MDKMKSVLDISSKKKKKMANTIAINMSINSDRKKVRHKIDCYILHTALLVIVLLFIITIMCNHYGKNRSKQKGINALTT